MRMGWNILPETFLKRIFRYLLKRYFGQYIQDFSLDQLDGRLWEGKGEVENVQLNVESLNELMEEYNQPVKFLHASIDLVSFRVPVNAIFSESTVIELKGLKLTVQPKERLEDVSMFDSDWNMTTSLQLAEECLNSNSEDVEQFEVSDRSEGLESIAKIIDAVVANMRVVFRDTSLKIEHIPGNGSSGVALEIKIASAEYFDEAGTNSPLSGREKPTYEPQSYSFKKIIFEGVSLFTAQFSAESRAFQTKLATSSNYMEPSGFVPGSPEMPPTHSSFPVKKIGPELNGDPILISKLTGQQELRLKLKQNEAIIGPKVDVEFNLGAVNLFLIPQQIHMLYELLSELLKPGSKHETSDKNLYHVANKPMGHEDYVLVEQELLRQQQKCQMPSRSLKNQHGWSSHSLDESADFQCMTLENQAGFDFQTCTTNDNDSLSSSICSDTRSDIAGNFLGSNRRSSKSKGSSVQALLQDQLSELTHFRGSFSSLLIIILHDDSVQESLSRDSSEASKSNSSKLFSLKDRAETFFNDLLALQMSGLDFKNFSSTRGPLSKLCDTNHLRIMASSISIDASEKSSSAQCIVNFALSLFQFEVLECLFNSANFSAMPQTATYVEVLLCDNKVNLDDPKNPLKEACFKLKYQQTEYTTQSRLIKPPPNRLDIQFGLLTSELDISLTDRIQSLLNFQKFYGQMEGKYLDQREGITRSSPKTDVNIKSPHLILNLRFPIPDLRSLHDMDRVPWWQQNIHPEILTLEVTEFIFKTSLGEDTIQTESEIQCRDLHGLFKQSDVDEPLSFLRVSVEGSKNDGFDWPRLVIKTTKASGTALEPRTDEIEELCAYSISDDLMSNIDSEPSPFKSTSVAYGSKLQSQKDDVENEEKTNYSIDHDEVIKPADKETILSFIDQTASRSELVLEFFLQTANVVLPSKEFFELLYNRLGSDLLLWESTTLAPKAPYDTSGFKVHVPGLDFNPCVTSNSGLGEFPVFQPFSNDSNSDSEEDEPYYHSVHEYTQKENSRHKKVEFNNTLTKLSIAIFFKKGSCTFHTPALDIANRVLPEVCGKLQLYVENCQIFLASSYKGDTNESYLCVLAEKSTLYHNGTAVKPLEFPTVEPLRCGKPQGLDCIIYESEQGMRLKSVSGETFKADDMLKIAVHTMRSPKQLLKTFKVAIDISNATLRHHMHISPQMWINQLIDFLKVDDFPVNGYTPSAVVTEFHFNLSNCAIDYRPLKLALLLAITVENFNMSCNIAATTPTFLFRIISEEMRFFISNNTAAKKVELKKNYVCVIDTGLIDISSRTSYDEKNEAKQELSLTNNIIHIRACSDSCKGLMDLLIHVSTKGDMDINDFREPEIEKDEENCHFKDSESEKVHLMMVEAMKECAKPPISGENDVNADETLAENETIVNTDDEFCILGDEPGVGLIPRNGEPHIRMLTDGPIHIVENHFSVPPGKSDSLKAPKHFPKPNYLFKLREMSLVLHLYGGSDFRSTSGKKRSPNNKGKDIGVTFSDEKNTAINADHPSVFCKVTPVTRTQDATHLQYTIESVILGHGKESNTNAWLCEGGPNRDHDVLMELQLSKIKFQREIYPLDSEYASRYVLVIKDVEIRDRLKSSNINKFLYQYSSHKLPRQSNADMVEVKAIYTRADPNSASEECSLNVSCKPLRLNIDQDSFIFFLNYIRETNGIIPEESDEEGGDKETLENKYNFTSNQERGPSSSPETFYKVFTFSPALLIRIDYQGKHFVMEQGALIKNFFLGLGKLNASEIYLKRLCYRKGLLGHHKVIAYAMKEWQTDILRKQLPYIFGGIGPMNSFVQLFQGIKDLFWLPVEQYQKDGQIIRGLQRGVSSFIFSAGIATLDILSGCVGTVQNVAMLSHDMVSPGPSVAYRFRLSHEKYYRTSQPADIREGITKAYHEVRDGIGDTARNIIAVASAEHEHKGVTGVVGSFVREGPGMILTPIVAVSTAAKTFLHSVENQCNPDNFEESCHKWKTKNG